MERSNAAASESIFKEFVELERRCRVCKFVHRLLDCTERMRALAIKMTLQNSIDFATVHAENVVWYGSERDHSSHRPTLFLPDFLNTDSRQVFYFLIENSTSVDSHASCRRILGPAALK
jgi:glutaredoxin